ncbi:MAG TPA: hypothetical protein VL053_03310 [Arachidicoccus sp.]|nr:hypothetical protein [Arachidicoccus sp.]
MPLIELTPLIKAFPEHCFDLAGNIALHQPSKSEPDNRQLKELHPAVPDRDKR